jgi:ribonuclease HI
MSHARPISKSVASELLRAETQLLDPDFRRDRNRVDALLAPDFVEIGASGRLWTREAILDLLASEDYAPPVLEDFTCHPIAAHVVLVTYRTVCTDAASSRSQITLRSSLWIRQPGTQSPRWTVRFHQGTRAL